MYQVLYNGTIIHDVRDNELTLLNPKCTLEVNKVDSASFTIKKTHPSFRSLKKMKGIFEIKQGNSTIFRGRMPKDGYDLTSMVAVQLEGILGCTNDTLIPPFDFPNDFPEATTTENVVALFLGWIIDQHNSRCQEWQKLKLGTVTVTDPNNVLTRSNSKWDTTWKTLESKLFNSALGGYLLPRYEADGTYIDYLAEFTLTNTQPIRLAYNLCDLSAESDGTGIFTAMLPLGAELEDENGNKTQLSLASLPDGDLTEDIVKEGQFIYSKSGVAEYGWICLPVEQTTWSDVTLAERLKTKAVTTLSTQGMRFANTYTFQAVDLHFADREIASFRHGRNVLVDIPLDGINDSLPLVKLDLDLAAPQGTKITVGSTVSSLTDINHKEQNSTMQRVEIVEKDLADNRTDVNEVKNQLLINSTQIVNDCERIIMSALESYVESSNHDEFRSTVEAEFAVMSEKITMTFESVNQQITNVDGDLQSIIETIYKHFEFNTDGLTITAGENTMNLRLDNDMIIFTKNGQQFGWWDGVDFHTGNIVVEVNERAQFGDYAFVPRSNGSLSFLKVR